jgi:signal transduction histidine kinase
MLDERRVEQVITNLMANAIRHARTGGVIRVETGDRCDAGAARVEVSIEDDGEGVAQADRERIFEPYVRGVDQPAGLGIGLTLCRRIMEAHGGSIRVENSALGGARFVLDWSRTAAVEEKDVDEIG